MKSKLVTVLSVLGVVSAGAAAGAVNTQALQSKVSGTVGDATALLGTTTPAAVPTPVVTVTRTAAPVAVKTITVPAPGSQKVTSNTVERTVSSTPTHRATPSASVNRQTINSAPVATYDSTPTTPTQPSATSGTNSSGSHAYSGGSTGGTAQGTGSSVVNGYGEHENGDNRGDDSNESANGDD
jgi:hypothetical protein